MLMRTQAIMAILALAVVIHTALVQFGATQRTEIEGKAQVAIAQAMAGKTTIANVKIQIGTKRDLEEKLPDASPALAALAGGARSPAAQKVAQMARTGRTPSKRREVE